MPLGPIVTTLNGFASWLRQHELEWNAEHAKAAKSDSNKDPSTTNKEPSNGDRGDVVIRTAAVSSRER
jgi:hypothetical protein